MYIPHWIHLHEKEHALAKIVKGKSSAKIVTSDHNVMITKFNVKWDKKAKIEHEEMFNFKDKNSQKKFKDETTNTNKFSAYKNKQTKKFLKCLKRCVHKCFRKVKIRKEKPTEYEKLYMQWTDIRNKVDKTSQEKSKIIENELADKYSETIYKDIKEEIENIKYDEGGINSGSLWKLKNKLNRKYHQDGPTAMKDEFGNLLTNKKEILDATVKHFKNVLRNRPIKDDLQNHQTEREELATKKIELASKSITPDWNMEELEVVLKYLKKNKSKDALGYINKLFRPEVCGEDLKLAILKMMNVIK